IVLVTHDVQEAFELADRICLMDKGKIIQVGTPTELLFKPATDFVKSFFNEQRLQLEYKSLTIKMLWKFLNDDADNNSSSKEIEADKNIWQVLEFFSLNDETLIAKNNSQPKKINYALLMKAFSNYKKAN
ncbi:MAG: ABC transporter ATP-binding protein, partial [Parafilimonas sp.]